MPSGRRTPRPSLYSARSGSRASSCPEESTASLGLTERLQRVLELLLDRHGLVYPDQFKRSADPPILWDDKDQRGLLFAKALTEAVDHEYSVAVDVLDLGEIEHDAR